MDEYNYGARFTERVEQMQYDLAIERGDYREARRVAAWNPGWFGGFMGNLMYWLRR